MRETFGYDISDVIPEATQEATLEFSPQTSSHIENNQSEEKELQWSSEVVSNYQMDDRVRIPSKDKKQMEVIDEEEVDFNVDQSSPEGQVDNSEKNVNCIDKSFSCRNCNKHFNCNANLNFHENLCCAEPPLKQMRIEEYFQQDRTDQVGRGSNGEMPTILTQALNGSAITYRWIIDQKNTINHMENLFDGILIHREIVRGERRNGN